MHSLRPLAPAPLFHVSDYEHGAYDSNAVCDEQIVLLPTGDEERSMVIHRTGESRDMTLKPLLNRIKSLASENVALKRN